MAADDDKLVDRVTTYFKEAEQALDAWRVEAKESYDFVAGHQWSAEDVAKLEDELRPVITFNRIGPVVDAVGGLEVQNRQEVRFIPRELGDRGVNELATGAAKWSRDLCDAEDEESEAFMDAVVCGMGWTETRMDYETDPDGLIVIERRDPLRFFWDPSADKANIADARWLMYFKDLPREEFRQLWPEAESIGQAPWDNLEFTPTGPIDADERDRNPYKASHGGLPGSLEGKKTIRVCHFQWWERGDVYRVADPQGGQSLTLSRTQFNKVRDNLERLGATWIKQTRRIYYQAFIAGDQVLDRGDGPCDHSFSFRCITGKRDRNNGHWFGLVRPMRDPQSWANKFFSQILHIINSNAKGGAFAEAGAFVDPRKAEEDWSNPAALILLRDGALAAGKLKERQLINYPAGLDRMLQFAITSIPDVTGVNLELLGLASREQAGILEYQRKQAGLAILARLFNNLRRYRKEQGRVLLYFIQHYISDGRLIRVVGDINPEYVRLLKENTAGTFDIIVDDAPSSPNMKEKVWMVLTDLLPSMLKAGAPIPPEILDYSPLPESLATKWKEMLMKPDPQQQAAQQLEMQARTAEIAKTQADTSQSTAKAIKTANEAAQIAAGDDDDDTGPRKSKSSTTH